MRRIAIKIDPRADVDRGWALEYAQRVAVEHGVELAELADPAAVAALLVVDGAPDPATLLERAALEIPVLWVDIAEASGLVSSSLPEHARLIRGRGIDGIRWALAQAVRHADGVPERLSYGDGPDQFLDLRLPSRCEAPHPVAVFLHGGFWRDRWTLDTIEPLAVDLAARGFATCNVEYRRVGPSGGGWPRTDDDVAAAIRLLAADPAGAADPDLFDRRRIVIAGHSAGAQLAVVAATRALEAGLRPRLVVSLAGVLDLRLCARRGLGDTGNAATGYVGATPDEADERYEASSPISLAPLGLQQLVVQGLDDSPDLAEMSRRYVAHARRGGDEVEHLELAGDHFSVITPSSEIWRATATRIEQAVLEA